MTGDNNGKADQHNEEEEARWHKFVEDLAEGKLSIVEVIRGTTPLIAPKGDYEGHVAHTRAAMMLLQDVRILKRLRDEIDGEVRRFTDGDYHHEKARKDFVAKDGPRLFARLGTLNAEMYGDSPSLLQGGSFDECLQQYLRLIGHVEMLWDDACRHFSDGRFPLSTFLSILVIEEVGKLGRLWFDLLAWDRPLPATRSELGQLGRNHHKKHFMGVIPGAVVNARLDRILGKARIKKLLEDVDDRKLERLRQSCLYIDVVDGKTVLPGDAISSDTAKFYVVLAGELWAEILGHFPWEFERMIKKVISFEVAIGFTNSLVSRE